MNESNMTLGLSMLLTKELIKSTDEKEVVKPTSEQIESYRYFYGNLEEQLGNVKATYEAKQEVVKGDKKQTEKLDQELKDKQQAIIDNFKSDKVVIDKINQERQGFLVSAKKSDLDKSYQEATYLADNYYYVLKSNQGYFYSNVSSINKETSQEKVDKVLKELGVGQLNQIDDDVYLNMDRLSHISPQYHSFFSESYVPLTATTIAKKGSQAQLMSAFIAKQEKRANTIKLISVAILLSGGVTLIYMMYHPLGTRISWIKKLRLDDLVVLSLVSFFILTINMNSFSMHFTNSEPRLQYVFPVSLLLVMTLIWSILMMLLGHMLTRGKVSVMSSIKEMRLVMWYKKIKRAYYTLPAWMQVVLVLAVYPLFVLFIYHQRAGKLFGVDTFLFILLTIYLIFSMSQVIIFAVSGFKLGKSQEQFLIDINEPVKVNDGVKGANENFNQIKKVVLDAKKQENLATSLQAELLTNVSHDLRTPLTAIISYGDLLEHSEGLTENQEKYVSVINQKSSRMKRIIDDVFTVSKMNHGEVELRKEEIDITQMIQQIIAEYYEEFKEKELVVLYNKPEVDLVVDIDGEKIWRVLDNLLTNALKYSLPGTRVYIRVSQVEEHILIEMKNIANYQLNEDATRLVEKFQRGDTSRNTEGTGLGLAIVESIVLLHGGVVRVKVDGDMFKVTVGLPL